jgi:hypothetical protein
MSTNTVDWLLTLGGGCQITGAAKESEPEINRKARAKRSELYELN